MNKYFFKRMVFFISFIVIILNLAGCSNNDSITSNHNPTITGVFIPEKLQINQKKNLFIEASDPDNDSLSYKWVSEQGTINGEGKNVEYIAPDAVCTDQISVQVSDGKGGETSTKKNINIGEESTDDTLFLNSIENKVVNKGELLTFGVSVQNPSDEILTYSAFGSLQDFFDPVTQTFEWIPNSADIGEVYNIKFRVENESGEYDEDSISITVNSEINNSKIVFVKYYYDGETGDFEIVTANPNGTEITRITYETEDAHPENPTWSPDGDKIAYYIFNSDNHNIDIYPYDIYVVNLIDGSKTLLTQGENPKWSPDGTEIAFDRREEIYIKDLSDGTERLIVPGQNADWSPDGSKIVYNSRRSSLKGSLTDYENIYIYDIDTENIVQIDSIEGTNATHPAWSPDGTKIAFNVESTSLSEVRFTYIMDADGSNTHKLLADDVFVENQSFMNPSWSPDGNEIVFNDEFFTYIVGLDGKYVTSVGTASLSPSGNLALEPEWSPEL